MPRQTLFLVPDAPIPLVDPARFYQTPNSFTIKAIRAKLTGADWCVWSYLQMLDPFGDRMKDIPNPQEIGKAIALGAKQVKRSLQKLDDLGLYSTEIMTLRGMNLAGAAIKEMRTKLSDEDKVVQEGQSCPKKERTKLSALDKVVQPETKLSNEGQNDAVPDKPVPEKTKKSKSTAGTVTQQGVEIPNTLNTFSDLLNTLSEGTRESFEKFCKKKMDEVPFKIGSRLAWLKKYGAEYLAEFKETYSDAVEGRVVLPPKAKIEPPDIRSLQMKYGSEWRDAALHFGYELDGLEGECSAPAAPAQPDIEEPILW